MIDRFIDPLQKAKNYAFLLLKFRPRSEKEIYQRLKQKKFDEALIGEVLAFLKEKGFIDDVYFARAWIESRLKKPLGIRRIKQELKVKGIAKEIIDNQIAQLKDNYSEEEIIAKIIQARFNKLKSIEPQKARQRILAYLVRRGFSPDAVINAIRERCKQIP